MTALPLIKRPQLDTPFARVNGETISAGRFLAHAESLAKLLPANVQVINLCEDYYYFLLGFSAALLRENTTLLPPNRAHDTIEHLCHEQKNSLILCDQTQEYNEVACINCRIALPEYSAESTPDIPSEQTCAILYTSGSSGTATPHEKSWGMMVDGARRSSERLAILAHTTLLGTVPPQHMFGFETTVMLPLQCDCAIDNRRPLLPADISSGLDSLPTPRALITTPLQLRVCAGAQQQLPGCDFILSATAPLENSLAQQIETLCDTTVKEIYGSTETGVIATRASASETSWLPLPEITLEEQTDGWWLFSPYLPAPYQLADRLQREGERFLLLGRNNDLIKVAGKRVSLGDLNHILLGIDGVEDGLFFLPESRRDGSITRLAAVVVGPNLSEATLRERLRQRIDAAFMPRPLLLLDELPRNEVGKLPRSELMTLVAER